MAVSLFITSACEIADTAIGRFAVGTTDGAVYKPVLSTVPTEGLPPVAPFTSQVSCVLLVPLTEAVNCCCSVGNLLALCGLTLTTTAPPPPPPPPLFPPPPHEVAIIADANTSALASTALVFLFLDGLRVNPPITMLAAGNHSQKGDPNPRFCALGRISVVPT